MGVRAAARRSGPAFSRRSESGPIVLVFLPPGAAGRSCAGSAPRPRSYDARRRITRVTDANRNRTAADRTRPRILVLAPHPDDESLAVGGLVQRALARGIDPQLVFVTDGEN
ncbi:MAG: hypothetical protein E6K72_06525, partial [Candidatus Eisenbacteria bacterium]